MYFNFFTELKKFPKTYYPEFDNVDEMTQYIGGSFGIFSHVYDTLPISTVQFLREKRNLLI